MSHPMEAHRADSRAMFSRGQSADAVEGVTSFLEKRNANYPDRVSGGLPDLGPLPPGDRDVLARALDRTPGRRFATCTDLVSCWRSWTNPLPRCGRSARC